MSWSEMQSINHSQFSQFSLHLRYGKRNLSAENFCGDQKLTTSWVNRVRWLKTIRRKKEEAQQSRDNDGLGQCEYYLLWVRIKHYHKNAREFEIQIEFVRLDSDCRGEVKDDLSIVNRWKKMKYYENTSTLPKSFETAEYGSYCRV